MKKWLAILILIIIPSHAYAYTEVLTNAIKNQDGMFFAYITDFKSGEYLITASQTDGGINICAYDEADGPQLTDVLEISEYDGEISIVKSGEYEYIRTPDGFYEIEDDTFKKCVADGYKTVIRIATLRNGRADTHKNTIGAAYNLLNDLKEQQIYGYKFIDRRNSMTTEALDSLRRIIVSVADIMSFDICDYDTDSLMRYVLNTHRNFYAAINYPYRETDSRGDIMLADAAFIDYVVKEMFNVTPTHPPVNELVDKGYCLSGDKYMYTKAFNVSFSTQLCDIETVYDVGEGVYFVIFGDIYTENGKSVPEYSYIILKDTGESYDILRLEMGAVMPSEHEVLSYAGDCEVKKYTWEKPVAAEVEKENLWRICIGAVAVLLVVFTILLCKKRKS